MGHAVHFLKRIKRLSPQQADFALHLYRDPDTVRHILAHVRLPERTDRVALAVGHERDGPHIIVSRDGGFVTCLGQGMSVGDVFVVPRHRIDRLTTERQELREAVERAAQNGLGRKLFRRLYRSGSNLSREEFALLRALYPLWWRPLFGVMVELAESLQQFRNRYRRQRFRRKSAEARETLRIYWELSWALGHLIALYGTMARDIHDQLTAAGIPDEFAEYRISWAATRTMSTPMIVRGAWAAARGGRVMLPNYKHGFDSAQSFYGFLDSVVGLTAIGLRHRRLRAQVRKVLSRRRSPILTEARYPDHECAVLLTGLFVDVLDREDSHREVHRGLGANCVQSTSEFLPAGHEPRPVTPEQVPDEVAYNIPLYLDTHLFSEAAAQAVLPSLLPWVSCADIDDLYLPADTRNALGESFNADVVLAQLDDYAMYTARHLPVRRPAKIGRNAPCPCSSGVKYKRCCLRQDGDRAATRSARLPVQTPTAPGQTSAGTSG